MNSLHKCGGPKGKEGMKMSKLKVAIIGCGNIFLMHAEPAYRRENVELVAVCDNKEERAKECILYGLHGTFRKRSVRCHSHLFASPLACTSGY